MSVPPDLQYSPEHEWLRIDGHLARVGITHHAAAALGDIVFVELPRAGQRLASGEVCGEIESTKSVSELFSPVDGDVVAVNEALSADSGVINSDPYGAGWLFQL